MGISKSETSFKEFAEPIEFEPLGPLVPVRAQTGPAASFWSRARILFALIVVLPTLCATIYFGFIAADQYASETRFLVRSPHRNAGGLLSGFLQSTGFVRAQDDSYSVVDFIRSRDAVKFPL